MLVIDQSHEVDLAPQSIGQIEQFADTLCDQLFINDTYYGSILMSLTELFSICLEKNNSETLSYYYTTNYQTVNIVVQQVDNEIVNCFSQQGGLDFDDEMTMEKGVYLISSLTDSIQIISEDSIEMTFDISAIHNKAYKHRSETLSAYFSSMHKKSVSKKNDSL